MKTDYFLDTEALITLRDWLRFGVEPDESGTTALRPRHAELL